MLLEMYRILMTEAPKALLSFVGDHQQMNLHVVHMLSYVLGYKA